MSGAAGNELDTVPVQWRADMLKLMLRVCATFGVLVYIPSVYLAMSSGLLGIVIVDTTVLAVIIALLRFEKLPYVWRASALCALLYAVGVTLLLSFGVNRQIYLFISPILGALLLGQRTGLGASLVASISFFVIGAVGRSNQNLTSWFVVTLNFALVNILLTLAIGSVLRTLENALKREIGTRTSLGRERTLLRALFDALPDVVIMKDPAGRYVDCNAATLTALRLEHDTEIIGKTIFDLQPGERAERIHAEDMAVIAGQPIVNQETQNVDPDGNIIYYLTAKIPLRDAAGNVTGLLGISRNITEHHKLQDQYRQAQKMEAIGQLAGGVAHDFNNLLTVIIGYTELLKTIPDLDALSLDAVNSIGEAGERAASLTRRLLAFSRQTILQPRVVDVNAVVGEAERLLRRLIGEDIVFTTELASNTDRVRVDPSQLDQIIMNLVVNARDAMPQGGQLTIETGNIEFSTEYAAQNPGFTAGHHVMLAVSDTGMGMTPQVKARIFEPFFTTKRLGDGTGLGLAMVFGTVEQSGGHIHVYSEPGHGSTFRIYFPAATEDVARPTTVESTSGLTGTETILLVEDDAAVRELAYMSLHAYGYTVVTAVDGQDALRKVGVYHGRIDALLTDVIMPNTSGPELASQLTSRFAHLKVLFMSGYTDDAVVRHGLLRADVAFIQKPYTPIALAQKLRAVLDG